MEPVELQASEGLVKSKPIVSELLLCGILSSLIYAGMNILCGTRYDGYSFTSQTVSELSAIDAPTRPLWVSLAIVYSMFMIAFGWGVWQSGVIYKRFRIAGLLLIANAIIGLFWPPMHQREVLAAGGGSLTDTLHIVFSFVSVLLMSFVIVLSTGAFGTWFRLYSVATLAVMLAFGILTGLDAPEMEANLPTPWMGLWERISIGAYMLWIIVFAVIVLMKKDHYTRSSLD
jgi:hypothetical protein